MDDRRNLYRTAHNVLHKSVSNKLIMASKAGASQIDNVKKWLNEFYGSQTVRIQRIEIIRSSLADGKLHQSHDYIAEVGGLSNYNRSFDMFVDQRMNSSLL